MTEKLEEQKRVADAVLAMIWTLDMADSYRMEVESSPYHFARHELKQHLKALSFHLRKSQEYLFRDYEKSIRGIDGMNLYADTLGERNDERKKVVEAVFDCLGHEVPQDRVERLLQAIETIRKEDKQ